MFGNFFFDFNSETFWWSVVAARVYPYSINEKFPIDCSEFFIDFNTDSFRPSIFSPGEYLENFPSVKVLAIFL